MPFAISRTRALALVLSAVALVLVGGRVLRPAAPRSAAPPLLRPAQAVPRAASPAARVVVDVAGAVRRPGLYRLPRGARIADALARAGGPAAGADVALVNLAAPLADGEQVLVPARSGPAGPAAPGPAPASPAAPVDLNSASAEQLDALPGIGPVTAEKIVAYRQAHGPFRSVDELDAIPGIGPARIENLRGLVVP
ncbi:MAG TPA: ComEA family DNA-binding protein [Gaiellaceae bacterium]|nr:ComEA family DNA-binding protein [Gaiellaceae bacterium]